MHLIDSDIRIWLTRGDQSARKRLAQIAPWRISVITYLEIAQGCRNRQELERAKRGLRRRQTEIVLLTPAISQRAMDLIDAHSLSSGLLLADALIAATAIENRLTLLTGNARHFAAIVELKTEIFER